LEPVPFPCASTAGVPDRIQQVDDEELVRGPGQDEAGRLDGPRQDSPGHEALDEILKNRQWRAGDGGELFRRVGGQACLMPSSDLDEGHEPHLVPEADAVLLAGGWCRRNWSPLPHQSIHRIEPY
jgi:hypothetical protein